MERKTQLSPAINDPGSREVLRRSIERSMAGAVKVTREHERKITELQRHEFPNITVQSRSSVYLPEAVDGAILVLTGPLAIYAYDSSTGKWLGANEEVTAQNLIVPVSALSYIRSALVTMVATGAFSATINIKDSSGATIATQAASGTGAGVQDVSISLGILKTAPDVYTFLLTGVTGTTPTILPRVIINKAQSL